MNTGERKITGIFFVSIDDGEGGMREHALTLEASESSSLPAGSVEEIIRRIVSSVDATRDGAHPEQRALTAREREASFALLDSIPHLLAGKISDEAE